jgi:APA family basic amino acid/polyamine antiporter
MIYIVLAAFFCVALVWASPTYSLWGLGITLIGLPLYYLAGRNKQ